MPKMFITRFRKNQIFVELNQGYKLRFIFNFEKDVNKSLLFNAPFASICYFACLCDCLLTTEIFTLAKSDNLMFLSSH